MAYKDISQQTFGRLTAIQYIGRDQNYNAFWECLCLCGETCVVRMNAITAGRTRSCGCLHREVTIKRMTKHGHSKRGFTTPEIQAFYDAKNRCCNPANERYADYGGRDIEFRLTHIDQVINEIGYRPSDEYSFDRIDNDGHYELGNIRWATRSEQQVNVRPEKQIIRTTKASHVRWNK